MPDWKDASTQVVTALIVAAILGVSGWLWAKRGSVGPWFSARPWAAAVTAAFLTAAVTNIVVMTLIFTKNPPGDSVEIISDLAIGAISRPLNAGVNPISFEVDLRRSGLLMANFAVHGKVKGTPQKPASSLTILVDGKVCATDRAINVGISPMYINGACFQYLKNRETRYNS